MHNPIVVFNGFHLQSKPYPNGNVFSMHITENVCITRSRINLSTVETFKMLLLNVVVL